MAEAEVKKQARRARKKEPEVTPEVASAVSEAANPKTTLKESPKAGVTKLASGLVVISR